jgi:hypothetical protein
MRYQDIVMGEFLKFKEPDKRCGHLKAVGIVLANQDHSIDWKYKNQKKFPFISVLCEHKAFSKHDSCGLIRRLRPRDLVKE